MADIAKGVRSFTIGTALSRVLGLVRESVFAFLYGAGRSTDAFNAAFRIPNLLRDLFAETALSAAFIPVLTDVRQKGKDAQNLLASNVLNALFLLVGVITIAGIFLAPLLVKIIAFGFGPIPDKFNLTVRLTAIMFPFLLFVVLAAWVMSYLNAEEEFLLPSLAPAFFNLFSILVPVLSYGWLLGRNIDPIYAMAVGVLIGGFVQFLIQLPRLYQKGFRYKFYLNFTDPNLLKMLALFVPVAIGLAGVTINTTVSTVIISFLEERSMTWLNYAYRIMHLPLGLFGIAVGTVTLPALSRLVTENRKSEIKGTLFDSLKLVLFLTVSTSAIIAFLATPITRLIYQHGKFTSFDTWATSQALILYIIGVPFTAGIRNVAAVFYAYKDAKTPMYASFLGIAVNVGLNLLLMRALGFRAFPLAISVSALANIALLMLFLPRKIGAYEFQPILRYFLLLVLASGAAGFCGWIVNIFWMKVSTAFYFQILGVLVSGLAACAIFYLLSLALGLKEVKDYLRRLIKK